MRVTIAPNVGLMKSNKHDMRCVDMNVGAIPAQTALTNGVAIYPMKENYERCK